MKESKPYFTEDIDMKICFKSYNSMEIKDLRQLIKNIIFKPESWQLLNENKEFNYLDQSEWENRPNIKSSDENVPFKITAPINKGEFKNKFNPTEYDSIAEITFSKDNCDGIDHEIIDGLPVLSVNKLIDNLLYATEDFKRKIQEKEGSIWDGKVLRWMKQLQKLLPLRSNKNEIDYYKNEMNSIKRDSPLQEGGMKIPYDFNQSFRQLEEIHTKIVDHLPEEFKELWWRDYDKHRRLIKELQINKNKYVGLLNQEEKDFIDIIEIKNSCSNCSIQGGKRRKTRKRRKRRKRRTRKRN